MILKRGVPLEKSPDQVGEWSRLPCAISRPPRRSLIPKEKGGSQHSTSGWIGGRGRRNGMGDLVWGCSPSPGKWSSISMGMKIICPYFLFLTDFRCYCLACDAEIDCRFVEPVFEPVCWLVVPLIFAECGLIDRVGMKFIIVICRTKYLFWNPQIGSVRNSKSASWLIE